jgi:hypothetical protein
MTENDPVKTSNAKKGDYKTKTEPRSHDERSEKNIDFQC